jgi:hypothetical protein
LVVVALCKTRTVNRVVLVLVVVQGRKGHELVALEQRVKVLLVVQVSARVGLVRLVVVVVVLQPLGETGQLRGTLVARVATVLNRQSQAHQLIALVVVLVVTLTLMVLGWAVAEMLQTTEQLTLVVVLVETKTPQLMAVRA